MTRFVFNDEGKLFREDLTIREISITPGVVSSLFRGEPIAIPGIVSHQDMGLIGLSADPVKCWWTVQMKSLMLRCRFRHVDDGTVVPDFGSDTSPVLSIRWTPPEDMKILLFVPTCRDSESYQFRNNGASYLFAMSDDKNLWRFPIGNLYDDCKLCLGAELFSGTNHLTVVREVWNQLEKSEWNADLWTGERAENTRKLFRFKVENEGFTQLPIENDWHWTALCTKISLALSERIVI